MASLNLINVLSIRCVAVNAKQGCDAVVGTLGLRMPEALSHRLAEVKPFEGYPSCVTTHGGNAIRIGRSAVSLPGKSDRSRTWRESRAWTTSQGLGSFAESRFVFNRGGSDQRASHRLDSDHDYQSHDRHDEQCIAETGRMRPTIGSAFTLNSGK